MGLLLRSHEAAIEGVIWAQDCSQAHMVVGNIHFSLMPNSWQLASSRPTGELSRPDPSFSG